VSSVFTFCFFLSSKPSPTSNYPLFIVPFLSSRTSDYAANFPVIDHTRLTPPSRLVFHPSSFVFQFNVTLSSPLVYRFVEVLDSRKIGSTMSAWLMGRWNFELEFDEQPMSLGGEVVSNSESTGTNGETHSSEGSDNICTLHLVLHSLWRFYQ